MGRETDEKLRLHMPSHLAAHLYFFSTHRPTQKNPKEPPIQRTKSQQT